MGVAGGEEAICHWVVRILLDGEQQLRRRLTKTPAHEMRDADCRNSRPASGTRAETERGLDMLDRDVGLTRPVPEGAAHLPPAREARIERQRSVHQRHHGANVLAEIGKRSGGIRKGTRVVAGHLQSPPCEIRALPSV